MKTKNLTVLIDTFDKQQRESTEKKCENKEKKY